MIYNWNLICFSYFALIWYASFCCCIWEAMSPRATNHLNHAFWWLVRIGWASSFKLWSCHSPPLSAQPTLFCLPCLLFHKQECREFPINLLRHYPPALFLPACNWLSHSNASFNGKKRSPDVWAGLASLSPAMLLLCVMDTFPSLSARSHVLRGISRSLRAINSRCYNQFVGSSRWFGKNCVYSPWKEKVLCDPRGLWHQIVR